MTTETTSESASIASLTHDLKNNKSYVLLVWDGIADKRLSLPVPFGISLDELPTAAEEALRDLIDEVASLELHMPD